MMKNYDKLSFIIFYTICLVCFSDGAAPKLNVPEEWVFEVTSNETGHPTSPLIITCSGDQPLTWNTTVNEEYYSVENNVTSEGKHFSSLTISEPFSEDTGNFKCINARNEITSTYVYIYDGVNGFVLPSGHRTISVQINDPIILDCRTTHPSIKVTVFKDNSQDITNRFQEDSFYRFRIVAESLQESGIYSCKENRFSSENTWLVNIEPRKTLQQPSIDKHRNSYYIVGVEFSLNCTIPIDQNDDPIIEWKLPNPDANKMTSSMKDEGNMQNIFAINTLVMKNPTFQDSGTYICLVKQGSFSEKDTTEIKIQERDSITPFVKFDPNVTQQSPLFVKEGDSFKWVLYFTGFPKELQYDFYDHFKRKMHNKDRRVTITYVYEEGKLSLEIKNTTAEDFGNYSVVMKAPNKVSDASSVILVVNATPKVEFDKVPSLFQVEETVSLKAFILAFELKQHRPTVNWWLYDECPRGIGSCDVSKGKWINSSLERGDGPINRYDSSVSLKPSSGLVECKVENGFGINSTKVYVNVSDKKEAFLVTVKTESEVRDVIPNTKSLDEITVIEGDNVTVECFSLNFLYKNLRFNHNETYNCSTTLSSGRCLDMYPITMKADGLFECTAENRLSNREEEIRFEIGVLEKMEPTILPGSNVSEEGTMISVRASDPFSINCLVEGQPEPTITWYKDGENIEDIPNYVDNKERVFLKRDNQVLEFKFAQREYGGEYVCNAKNRIRSVQFSASVKIEGIGLTTTHRVLIALTTTFIILLFLIVFYLLHCIRKESKLKNELRQNQLYLFEKGNVGDLNKECTIDEQADLLPYDKAYEVERERIKLGKQLGAGAFGRVMQAEVQSLDSEGHPTRLAVKMCKDGADMAHLRALTLELKIMVHLGKHLNIVNLMGAHTTNMNKGDLWILVEYCKYGNLLKHIQRYKSRFINQVDPNTGIIDVHRFTPFPNEPLSPASQGRNSRGFNKTPSVDADGYLETRSQTGSLRESRPLARNTSIASNAGSLHGTSRPGMYVGNPHYATAGFAQQTAQIIGPPSPGQPVTPPSGGSREHYVTANQLTFPPSPTMHESTASNPSSDGGYHMTVNTEITGVSSPPPFSPSSVTSGDSFFDSQGGGIPGITSPFTTTDLVCWAWQVANGMEYLAKRKVLHGDLAARNLLLAENNVVKISDFGLSRDMYKNDIYMKKSDEIMPIKWMAPEAIQQKVFSIQSDVWAFGITLWEMFTLGNTPYPGIPLNQDFPIALENGMRMEKPKYSNEEMYSLMLNCWRLNPLERPSFSRTAEMLSDMLSSESRENYVAMNTVYMRKNEEWMEYNEDYLNMVTSPDFENLQSPIGEAVVGGDSYIPMQVLRGAPDGGEENRMGYLDMRSVRSSPLPPDSIFSPRPSTEVIKDPAGTVFTFSGNDEPLSEDQQSPMETSNLLDQTDHTEKTEALVQSSNDSRNNNNNINKLNSLNQQQDPLYQNLEKVALQNKQSIIETQNDEIINDDHDISEDTSRNYMNIPKLGVHYVNSGDII